MKKTTLTAIACFALLPLPEIVHAQTPPPPVAAAPADDTATSGDKHALILQLLDLMKLDRMVSTMQTAMSGSMQGSMSAMVSDDPSFKHLSPAKRKAFLDEQKWAMKRTAELYAKEVDFKALITDQMLKLYDKYYTAAEIQDLITFYKSPTGQKSIDIMPKLMTESMQSTMQTLMPKMQSIIKQVTAEEKARAKTHGLN